MNDRYGTVFSVYTVLATLISDPNRSADMTFLQDANRRQSPSFRSYFLCLVVTGCLLPCSLKALPGPAARHAHAGRQKAATSRTMESRPKGKAGPDPYLFQKDLVEQQLKHDRRQLDEQQAEREIILRTPDQPYVSPAPAPPSAPPVNENVRLLREQLTEERKNLADLMTRYTDAYPVVAATRERISVLQEQLDRAIATSPRTAPPSPKPVVVQPPTRVQRLESIDTAIEQTERKISTEEHQYASLVSRGRAAKPQLLKAQPAPAIDTMLDQSDVGIDEETKTPTAMSEPAVAVSTTRPVLAERFSPQILSVAGAALVCFLGIIFVFVHQFRSRVITDGDSVRELVMDEVDYVGSIPRMTNE